MFRGYPDRRATSFLDPDGVLDGRAGKAGPASLVGVASERLRVTEVSHVNRAENCAHLPRKERDMSEWETEKPEGGQEGGQEEEQGGGMGGGSEGEESGGSSEEESGGDMGGGGSEGA